VVGPGELPLNFAGSAFTTSSGNAVRLFVVLRDDPYDSAAIGSFTGLQQRMPRVVSGAGLRSATIAWSGATPAAADAVAPPIPISGGSHCLPRC